MAPTPHPFRHSDGSIVWRVRFRVAPGMNPTSETFASAEEAQRFASMIEQIGAAAARDARDAMVRGQQVRTLHEALDHHLDMLSASVTPGTVDGYRRMAARTWLPRLGHMPVQSITRNMVTDWIKWQRGQPVRFGGGTYSTKSIRNAHALLSSVLAREVGDGHVPSNVAYKAPMPRDKRRTRDPVFLTPSQFTAILAAIPERHQPLIALLYGTGLRWGEATALTPQDLDLEAEVPVVRVSKAWKQDSAGGIYLGTPKTRRSVRSVALGPSLVTQLREQSAGKDGLLFPSARGGPLRTAYFHTWVWAPALERSGIGVKPRVHDLRHSHASWLISQRVPLPVIQRRLGHESIKTTVDTYGHLAPDSDAAVIAAAELSLVQAYPQIEP